MGKGLFILILIGLVVWITLFVFRRSFLRGFFYGFTGGATSFASLFCVYGFFAAAEPPGSPGLRIVYGIGIVFFLLLSFLLLKKSFSSMKKSLEKQ